MILTLTAGWPIKLYSGELNAHKRKTVSLLTSLAKFEMKLTARSTER